MIYHISFLNTGQFRQTGFLLSHRRAVQILLRNNWLFTCQHWHCYSLYYEWRNTPHRAIIRAAAKKLVKVGYGQIDKLLRMYSAMP